MIKYGKKVLKQLTSLKTVVNLFLDPHNAAITSTPSVDLLGSALVATPRRAVEYRTHDRDCYRVQ